jgi:hypothetical protein
MRTFWELCLRRARKERTVLAMLYDNTDGAIIVSWSIGTLFVDGVREIGKRVADSTSSGTPSPETFSMGTELSAVTISS